MDEEQIFKMIIYSIAAVFLWLISSGLIYMLVHLGIDGFKGVNLFITPFIWLISIFASYYSVKLLNNALINSCRHIDSKLGEILVTLFMLILLIILFIIN